MNECKVTFHPVFVEAVKDAAELDEERTRLQAVMGADTFERVRAIIEAQPARKRAAYYWTICKAAGAMPAAFAVCKIIRPVHRYSRRFRQA